MKIVSVIPLARAIGKETLTYFTAKEVKIGSFVSVPIRNREVTAIVTSVDEALKSKSVIKEATYGMKKISTVHDDGFFLPAFIKAAERTADYFAATTGSILETLTPQSIITDHIASTKTKHSQPLAPQKISSSDSDKDRFTDHEKLTFQADEKERVASYKSLIREYFARKQSLFLCFSTVQDIERMTPTLTRGIEDYTFVLHSGLSKKALAETWEKALAQKHPVLIIGTGTFLCLPRQDIGTIIIERENTNSYKTRRRPYIDIRTFIEFFAEELGVRLIYGDIFLRVQTLYRKENQDFMEFVPAKFRSLTSAQQQLLDMKKSHTKLGDKKFTLIANELTDTLRAAQENNEPFFLLTSRRGLYPLTVCNDCGETVRCNHCDSPLVLHGKKEPSNHRDEKNIFMCHTCGDQTRSRDICRGCGGWRLATLGIGSERVEEEVKKLFPKATVLRLDKDTAARKNKAQEIVKKFYESPNSILIGTEMAVPYLYKDVPNAAVVSVDSLFTIPDFKIYERVFALLLQLRDKTVKNFFIQTRLADTALFQNVLQGNLLNFYREEIKERKQFHYPPFSLLIKVTRTGKKYLVQRDMDKLKIFLEKYNPIIFPSPQAATEDKYTAHALIRINASDWPDTGLHNLLLKLPPSFTIKVDPEDVL